MLNPRSATRVGSETSATIRPTDLLQLTLATLGHEAPEKEPAVWDTHRP